MRKSCHDSQPFVSSAAIGKGDGERMLASNNVAARACAPCIRAGSTAPAWCAVRVGHLCRPCCRIAFERFEAHRFDDPMSLETFKCIPRLRWRSHTRSREHTVRTAAPLAMDVVVIVAMRSLSPVRSLADGAREIWMRRCAGFATPCTLATALLRTTVEIELEADATRLPGVLTGRAREHAPVRTLATRGRVMSRAVACTQIATRDSCPACDLPCRHAARSARRYGCGAAGVSLHESSVAATAAAGKMAAINLTSAWAMGWCAADRMPPLPSLAARPHKGQGWGSFYA